MTTLFRRIMREILWPFGSWKKPAKPPWRPPRQPPEPITWMTSLDEVRALAERTGFAEAADEIVARCLPCLHVFEIDPFPEAPLGVTRFGGAPDLPRGRSWPVAGSGKALSFYAQIDLADLAEFEAAADLPRSGLLSFFAGDFDTGHAPVAVAVLLTPAGVPLERLTPPVGEEAFDDRSDRPFKPVSVRFQPGLSFPDFDFDWQCDLGDRFPDADIDALTEGLADEPGELLGRLLGYPKWHDNDLREASYFQQIGLAGKEGLRRWTTWEDWEQAKSIVTRLRGGRTYRPWSADDDETVRWLIDHAQEIEAGIGAWRALLSVESNHGMDLWIHDANAAYFLIPAEALAAGDFSSAQVTATQS